MQESPRHGEETWALECLVNVEEESPETFKASAGARSFRGQRSWPDGPLDV